MTKQDRQFNYIMFTNIADYSEIKSTDTKKTNNEIFSFFEIKAIQEILTEFNAIKIIEMIKNVL